MASGDEEKEQLILLDFSEKVSSELLQNKVFIRLANLKEKNPLIQVNDLIFKGTYDYSVGTNLLFKKTINDDPIEFPFKEKPEFQLDFLDSQTKVLKCKQMQVPSTVAPVPSGHEHIKFNLKWNYKELLKKLENGTLNLEDMVAKSGGDQHESAFSENEKVEEGTETEVEIGPEKQSVIVNTAFSEKMDVSKIIEIEMPVVEVDNDLLNSYHNLQILARIPVRRETVQEDCTCQTSYINQYEYRSIESKTLERPLFSYMKNKNTNFEDNVNIERCVTLGLLPPSAKSLRILTDQECDIVMTIDNFENLDLAARYSVLFMYIEELERQINCNDNRPELNSKKDNFGRTPLETLQIFKKLASSLNKRIQEIEMYK